MDGAGVSSGLCALLYHPVVGHIIFSVITRSEVVVNPDSEVCGITVCVGFYPDVARLKTEIVEGSLPAFGSPVGILGTPIAVSGVTFSVGMQSVVTTTCAVSFRVALNGISTAEVNDHSCHSGRVGVIVVPVPDECWMSALSRRRLRCRGMSFDDHAYHGQDGEQQC